MKNQPRKLSQQTRLEVLITPQSISALDLSNTNYLKNLLLNKQE